jgi:hypothetical protein
MQWVFFTSLMLFLLARLHNMTLWRGKGALDMHVSGKRNHRCIECLNLVLVPLLSIV